MFMAAMRFCEVVPFSFPLGGEILQGDLSWHHTARIAKEEPQWDVPSHLLGWLLSKRQMVTDVNKDVGKENPPALLVGM